MSFCSQCGHALKAGAKFCSKCGAQMSVPGPGACPVCHKPVAGNEKFCPHCGASAGSRVSSHVSPESHAAIPPVINAPEPGHHSPPVAVTPPVSPVVHRKKKGGCIWKSLLILVLLIVAAVTALYFYGDDGRVSGEGRGELTGTDIPGIVSMDDTLARESNAETNMDTGDPKQAAETVEDAFARADTALLKQMLTSVSREVYKEAFREIKPYMHEYSKAFSTRKLKISTPIYALYEFTDESGKKYTAEFALSDDGQWKMVRF